MKKIRQLDSIVHWMIATLLSIMISPNVLSAPDISKLPPFSSNKVMVSFKQGTPAALISQAHQHAGGNVIKRIESLGVEVVKVSDGTVLNSITRYRNNPNVLYAEPNYYRPIFLPDEGNFSATLDAFSEQWNLQNNGQVLQTYQDPNTLLPWEYTVPMSDIRGAAAWDIIQGNSQIKIAILDSGVDCAHPDLTCDENLDYVTATEDLYGTPIPELIDRIGHGSHVAGIAAANIHNNTGVAGVGSGMTLSSLKVCYAIEFIDIIIGSSCEDADIINALTYAADNGYNIINMSFGGPSGSAALLSAIDYAYDKGTILVAGAGNNYNWAQSFPAAYPNVISVGATDTMDNLAYFSNFNYGSNNHVDILAPGHPILSTVPGELCGSSGFDCLGWKSGTSMSAPHVAGVAGLVWSQLLAADSTLLDNLASKQAARDEIVGRFRDQNCADTTGAMGQNLLVWSISGRLNAEKILLCEGGASTPTEDVIFVSDIVVTAENLGQGNKQGHAMVTFTDGSGNPVSNINVSGKFSGKTEETMGAMANNGAAEFISSTVKGGGEWCFEITGVNDSAYDKTSNTVTKSCQSGDEF